MSTKLPVLNVVGSANASASSSAPAVSKSRAPSAKKKPRPPSHRPARPKTLQAGTGGGAAAGKVRDALKDLSPELQRKWSRVKARFRAVAGNLQPPDLKVSIQWNNGAIGATVSSPKRRNEARPSFEDQLSHKTSAKFTNVGVDKSEPIVVQARSLFDLFDQDHSGHLDRLEFKKLIRAVGGDVGLSGTEFSRRVKEDFQEIDVGGDSQVSFAEFHRYYRYLHKEVIAKQKRMARELRGHSAHELATQKDNEFFGKAVRTLDDAIRAGNTKKVARCLEKGEHFASGGIVPVVLAAHLGQFEVTQLLAASHELDASLLKSERQAIMDMCQQRNKSGLNGLMHDLYTQACERLKVVESLNNDNLDSARDNLKLTYYKNWGTNHKQQNQERASNVYTKQTDNAKEALLAAASNNQLGEAQRLLQSLVDPNYQDAKGSTALMSATWFGYLEMCKLLVQFKAQICIQNRRKNTAMHFAAEKHHRSVCYFFLSEKCSDGVEALRIKNCLGNTPTKLCKDIYLQDLLIAAKPPEVKTKINRDFRDQKKTGAKKDGYRNKAAEWVGVAARDDDLVSMQQHMGDFGPKQKQLINTPDFLGMYPLHYAVACARAPVVKCLLECKADLTAQSRTGNTPLHYAYSNGKKGIIKLLQEYGADFGIEELVNTFGNKYPNKEPVKPCEVEPFR